MSDADSQMGGEGSDTGIDPDEQSDQAPDKVTGNIGSDEPAGTAAGGEDDKPE